MAPLPARPADVLPAFVFATPLPLQSHARRFRLHARQHHRRRGLVAPPAPPRARRRVPSRLLASAAAQGSDDGAPEAPARDKAAAAAASPGDAPDAPHADPTPEQRYATRLATARDRAILLHFRLLERLAHAAVHEAEAAVASAATDPSPRATAAAARRLRRDLRMLRSSAGTVSKGADATGSAAAVVALGGARVQGGVEAPSPNPAFYVAMARLQSLVEDLERRADAELNYARERLQEQLEGPTRGADDVLSDSSLAVDDPDADDPAQRNAPDAAADAAHAGPAGAPLDAIRRRGADVRRTVSDVGSAIEGTVSEFVRDDGSIDVDGLRGWVRRVLDAIAMTWMRLNGRTPPSEKSAVAGDGAAASAPASGGTGAVGGAGGDAGALQRQEERESLRDERKEYLLREEIGALEKRLNDASKKRELSLRREDQLGKLMRAKELRQMDDAVSALRRTLAIRVLQLELEKVYVCLGDEIAAAAYDAMREQRVLVVEFGELDERLATLDLFVDSDEPLLIKDEPLGDLAADIQDMKLRLGIDDPLYSSANLSWTQVRQFLLSSSAKAREGAEFYVRGMRLFAGDVRFALRLIRRAVLGYTPTPREIRTLRRTGRDLLTLIPFTIVLIAPLTPVGHVLIFSFLQRYWPEFFPSTFSERRQAMMKRHEQYMRVLDADAAEVAGDGDGDGDDGDGGADEGDRMRRGARGGPGADGAAGRSGVPAVLAPLRDMLQLGKDGGENGGQTRRRDDDDDDSRPGDASGAARREVEARDGADEDESESVGVGLKDLAESVRGSEAVARKKRGGVALDELHLAD